MKRPDCIRHWRDVEGADDATYPDSNERFSIGAPLARKLGFNKEDEITIVFGGSKKSLATGVPMAQVLFTGAAIGPALLPIMIFHQIQLMACAFIANKYAQRPETPEEKAQLQSA